MDVSRFQQDPLQPALLRSVQKKCLTLHRTPMLMGCSAIPRFGKVRQVACAVQQRCGDSDPTSDSYRGGLLDEHGRDHDHAGDGAAARIFKRRRPALSVCETEQGRALSDALISIRVSNDVSKGPVVRMCPEPRLRRRNVDLESVLDESAAVADEYPGD